MGLYSGGLIIIIIITIIIIIFTYLFFRGGGRLIIGILQYINRHLTEFGSWNSPLH